jgi:hypothetical protein
MTGYLLLAYLASLPVDDSDLGASDLESVDDLVSDAGADEGFEPFPFGGGVPDFFA